MAISISVSESSTLKFDDVVSAILSEEMRQKSSGETSGNDLSAEFRGRKIERERAWDIIVNQGKTDPSPDWG